MRTIRFPVLSGVLLAVLFCNARAADNDPHLVGWWKFDETSGTCAVDLSKGKHNGVLEGDLTFDKQSVPGRIGKALQLDGAKNLVRITGYKGVTGTQARTLAVWVKTQAVTGEVVSWGFNDHGKMWTLGFIRKHLGVTPKGGYLYMKDSISDDTWHHVVVMVLEASLPNLHDNARLYKDGEPAVIDDIGLLDLWPVETGDKLDVTIGQRFKGAIDDLRIYNRALSEDEVKALFKSAGP